MDADKKEICHSAQSNRHAGLVPASKRLSSRHCDSFVILFYYKTRGRAFRPPNKSGVTVGGSAVGALKHFVIVLAYKRLSSRQREKTTDGRKWTRILSYFASAFICVYLRFLKTLCHSDRVRSTNLVSCTKKDPSSLCSVGMTIKVMTGCFGWRGGLCGGEAVKRKREKP